MHHRRLLPLAGLLAAGLLAGCTAPTTAPTTAPGTQDAAPGAAATATQSPAEPAASAPAAAPSADTGRQGADAVGIDLRNPPAAIASVSRPYSGQERITDVTVELIEVRKRDKLLYGIFRITAQGDFAGTLTLSRMLGGGWQPALLDVTNLKQYDPLNALTSIATSLEATAGQPVYAHAGWGYPEGASTVDIQVDDGFPPLEGVKIP